MAAHNAETEMNSHATFAAGNYDALLEALIQDESEREWEQGQIAQEGPAHKRLLSALLLSRLQNLVQAIEKSTGNNFAGQAGTEVVKEKHGEETLLPVQLPASATAKGKTRQAAAALAPAPEHESLAYLTALQAVEWAIKNVG